MTTKELTNMSKFKEIIADIFISFYCAAVLVALVRFAVSVIVGFITLCLGAL